MPLLQITTNIKVSDPDNIASKASKLVSELLTKPESYVMINLIHSKHMMFSGSDAPCAHLKLKSLGLDESQTCAYSEELCKFVENTIGAPASRCYIEFQSPARHMWGWDSGTF